MAVDNIVLRNGVELEVGKSYILDATFRSRSEIKVVTIYGQNFCRVECPKSKEQWNTMCNRITPII